MIDLEFEEDRKVQVTGGKQGSFVITLPKKWAMEVGLEQGKPVKVVVNEDLSLSLFPPGWEIFSRPIDRGIAKFPVSNKDRDVPALPKRDHSEDVAQTLLRKIISAYLIGYTEIHIIGKLTQSTRNDIVDFVQGRLIGLRPMTSSPDFMPLKVFGKEEMLMPMHEAFTDARKSVVFMLKSVCTLLEKVPEYDEEIANYVRSGEDTVASYYFYIVRQLKAAADNPSLISRIELKTGRDLLGCRYIVKSIERISNHAEKIVRFAKNLDSSIDKTVLGEIKDGLEMAIDVLTKAMDSLPMFRKPDFEGVNNAIGDAKKRGQKMMELRDKQEVQADSNLRIIVESVGRCCEYASDIGEIVLNLTVEHLLVTQRANETQKASSH